MSQTFSIPGRLMGLNEYTRLNRSNRYAANEAKRNEQQRVMFAARQARIKPVSRPVMLNYTWYEPDMRRDADNVIFAQKYVQDALVNMGILADDGRKHVVGMAHWVMVDRDNPRVEVEIQEI